MSINTNYTRIINHGGGDISYVNDKGTLHRLDGPAYYCNGYKLEYWVNGQLHNLNGPAVEYFGGLKRYFIFNKEYSENEWRKIKDLLLWKNYERNY